MSSSTDALSVGRARARFLSNVGSNAAYVALSVLTMLWYIPYLRDGLGVAAYGMIPLANLVVLGLGAATEGLDVAVNRYLTIGMHRPNGPVTSDDATTESRSVASSRQPADARSVSVVFNSSLVAALLAVVALGPITALTSILVPSLLRVPDGQLGDTRLVFGGVALFFLASVVAAVFQVSAVAGHRFDLRNAVRAVSLITRVLVVVALFAMLEARLWQVAVGFAFSGLILLVGMMLVWRRLSPGLTVNVAHCDRQLLRRLATLGGWSTVNQIGLLLFFGTDLLVVNRLFGARETGDYGSLIFLPQLLRDLIATVSVVVAPVLLAAFARADFAALRAVSGLAVKGLGLLIALPAGAVAGLGQPFLALWLGREAEHLDLVLAVMVGHFALSLATQPLSPILTAYRRVRVQGLVTLALGVTNVVLSIVLGRAYGLAGVALATALVFTIRNAGFTAVYTARLLDLPWWHHLRQLAVAALATVGVGVVARALVPVVGDRGWPGLIGAAVTLTAVYLPLAVRFGLNGDDRSAVRTVLPRPLAGLGGR